MFLTLTLFLLLSTCRLLMSLRLIIPLSFLLLHYFLMIPVGSLTTRHSPFTSLSPPLSLSLFLSSFVSTLIPPVCNFTFLVCLLHPSPHPSSLPLYTPDCHILSPFFLFLLPLYSRLSSQHLSFTRFPPTHLPPFLKPCLSLFFLSCSSINLHSVTCMSCHFFPSLLCHVSPFFLTITSFPNLSSFLNKNTFEQSEKFGCLCFICMPTLFFNDAIIPFYFI